jgi:hypothetical protein
MTFHRAWLLELEAALLAVAPGLKALPYWDMTLDNQGKHGTQHQVSKASSRHRDMRHANNSRRRSRVACAGLGI